MNSREGVGGVLFLRLVVRRVAMFLATCVCCLRLRDRTTVWLVHEESLAAISALHSHRVLGRAGVEKTAQV